MATDSSKKPASKQNEEVASTHQTSPLKVTRWALGIAYDGSAYHGWQVQKSPALPTVQGILESALSTVADSPVKTICAGRTDTGVHGTGQVVHFDTAADRRAKAWEMGANVHLPDTVSVQWAVPVDSDFHARFSALSRTYRYVIYNGKARPAVFAQAVTWVKEPLDEKAMQQGAEHLLGEQDFTSFRGSGCQSSTPMRCVTDVSVKREGSLVVLEITANAFLLHMVRNIAGTLIDVGRGKFGAEWVKDLLSRTDRCLASPTASPKGLYLVNVAYPKQVNLPQHPIGPFWLS